MANGLCDKFCGNCVYCQRTNGEGGFRICTYFLTTGIRRPCPAGTGCTVKKVGRAKSAWAYRNASEWSKKMLEAKKEKAVLRKSVCPCCGIEFESTVQSQKYCSKRCRNIVAQRALYERKKQAAQEET